MTKVFLLDVNKCNGCHNCQIACKDEHCDRGWEPYTKAQPETGQFWIKVHEKVRGSVPKVHIDYIPHGCMHCSNAPCIDAAKNDAVYRREDNLVLIDPNKAQGQKQLIEACPYNAIFWNDKLGIPQKCTGCAHLLDNGWDVPRCVDACPTGALLYEEQSELADQMQEATVIKPELNTDPNFYYLNLPKRFVAGEIYDPECDEVITSATITLAQGDTGIASVETDEFGDFWFKQIEGAQYTVWVEKEGYLTRTIEVDATNKDVNIGAFALYKS